MDLSIAGFMPPKKTTASIDGKKYPGTIESLSPPIRQAYVPQVSFAIFHMGFVG